MGKMTKQAGTLMASEIDEAPGVFATTCISQPDLTRLDLLGKRAIYTIARGSSDAAANILSYEFMREIGLPMTSLPPSVFSLGKGVDMHGAAALVISQSGASDDLVLTAQGVAENGGAVVAITNQPGSNVEAAAEVTIAINAGVERAVPATKSVIGSIAAGMAMLSVLKPEYAARTAASATTFGALSTSESPQSAALTSALLRARHVYVIGRDTGFGAAHEVALKLKECCALHAEAYSSSEVLHGPLQLSANALLVVMLDTEEPSIQASLDEAEARFRAQGSSVFRLRPSDIDAPNLTPAAAAALLLYMLYPIILSTALALGFDPDRPDTLAKVTKTT